MITNMKKIFTLILSAFLLAGLTSCDDWLDINTNPNSPTNVTAPVHTRLPWLQYAYGYAYGNASVHTAIFAYTTASRYGGTNDAYTAWAPGTGAGPTTPYQQWFVGGACNIQDLIDKAREEGAYHYIGAAHLIHAMGFMLMLDYHGEIPYTEALSSSLTPKYDDGQTIFNGCMERLDSALVNFQKEQPATATPLSSGDSWNNGDVQKWIKLCYGLKARWLNKLSKKSSLYDPQAILDAVANGPSSNAEGTIIHHVNDASDTQGSSIIGVGDPMRTAFAFDVAAWGNAYRITKIYLDRLENPRGSGIEDPRVDRLVPSSEHWANGQKFIQRTKGLDIINDPIRQEGGPVHISYNNESKKWIAGGGEANRQNDTLYCLMQARCAMQGVTSGDGTYYDGDGNGDGTIISTGTFYTLPESQTDVCTYHEMCFIKAEVLFRQGDKEGALQAYKEGIKAHIDLMQTKLREWGEDQTNPYKRPMDQAKIDAFLNSNAIAQTSAELTMADIMGQKHIAMTFTMENWNDIRRFNYSAGNIGDFGVVYPGAERPLEFTATSIQYFPGTDKSQDNYWYRRMKHCSHEINYNVDNLRASNPNALEPDVWSTPVWWDIAE